MKTIAIVTMMVIMLLSFIIPVNAMLWPGEGGGSYEIVTKDYSVTIMIDYYLVGAAYAKLHIYSDKSFLVDVKFRPFICPLGGVVFWAQCAFLLGSESYNLYGFQDGSANDFSYCEGNVNYGKGILFWYWYAKGYAYSKDWPGLLTEYGFQITGKLSGGYTWTQLRLVLCLLAGYYQNYVKFGQSFSEVWY